MCFDCTAPLTNGFYEEGNLRFCDNCNDKHKNEKPPARMLLLLVVSNWLFVGCCQLLLVIVVGVGWLVLVVYSWFFVVGVSVVDGVDKVVWIITYIP